MNLSNLTCAVKAVNSGNIPNILASLQISGYLILFILMFFEGPIVTLFAAYAASLNFFNVLCVLV